MNFKNIVKTALLIFTFSFIFAACKPAEVPSSNSHVGLNENTSVTLCGDPGFIVKNCSSQDYSGDWYTQAISMNGLTAFDKNPTCAQDECISWCWGPLGEFCCGTDFKATPRSPSTYSGYAKAPKDVALVHYPGQYSMWCSTNANHASITHLHVRNVSQPL